MNQTQISVELSSTLNINGNYVKMAIGVVDYKRESDNSTSDAIDRVYKLVEDKINEKVSEYDA